ncbi:MAG: hypothetical protein PHT59_05095 [Candidatus Omnitrophica bacterium]|nr:hypothetical protein [Candidatus Omnitrophota bacterium]
MTKQQVQIVVIAAGIPLMAFLFWSNFKPKKKKAASVPLPVAQDAPAPAAPAAAKPVFVPADAAVLEAQKKNAERNWGKDPFAADPYKAGKASQLHLQGISFRADKVGYAFINNEIVRAGDSIVGYEVVEILKDKVLLKKGPQSFYLTFPEQ